MMKKTILAAIVAAATFGRQHAQCQALVAVVQLQRIAIEEGRQLPCLPIDAQLQDAIDQARPGHGMDMAVHLDLPVAAVAAGDDLMGRTGGLHLQPAGRTAAQAPAIGLRPGRDRIATGLAAVGFQRLRMQQQRHRTGSQKR